MADGGIRRAAAEGYKPCTAMVATQCIFAAMTLWVKAAFGRGMSPMVFRRLQAGRRHPRPCSDSRHRQSGEDEGDGTGNESLLFGVSGGFVWIRATANQNLCYQGLHMGTSSMATTMTNLIPAITFVMAVAVGQERVNIREASSTAKILGTAVCMGGAITIAFFKGPKLPMQFLSDPPMLLHEFSSNDWVMGALFLVGSSSCWSLWLILQVNSLCNLSGYKSKGALGRERLKTRGPNARRSPTQESPAQIGSDCSDYEKPHRHRGEGEKKPETDSTG